MSVRENAVNTVALRVHVRGLCSSHVGDLLTQLGILDNISSQIGFEC
jgi:hypothetical protein